MIGTPDTDWVLLALNTQGNTAVRQMSSQAEEIESGLLKEFGSQIQYTFTQIRSPNRATIMARLHDKKDMMDVWKKMEARFTNTPYLKFSVFPWNPSELPIPNPPHLRLVVRGGEPRERSLAAKEILDLVQEKKIFPKSWSEPEVGRNESVVLTTNMTQWSLIRGRVGRITPADVADLARVANQGRRVGELTVDQMRVPINLAFTEGRVSSVEDLAALPVGLDQKIVPLKALAQFEVKEQDPMVYREDGRELMLIQARLNKGEERKVPAALKQAGGLLEQWTLGRKGAGGITAALEPASVDLDEALSQLGWAIAISVLLIFLVMVFQFGDVANSLLVLVSVPLGFIGVVLGLFVFQSTLSLNSALGVILLNGIAVANSIILVDFLKKKYEGGMSPREAALVAARSRLRPILMTSLTTGLGMAPIALGLGEGGRILQPLGIAVIGGLGFSMLTTLFTVPALQVAYLEWRDRRAVARRLVGVAASVDLNQQEIAMANQEALQMKPIMEKNLQQDLANQEIALANREAAQSVKTLVTGRDVTKADSNPPSLDI